MLKKMSYWYYDFVVSRLLKKKRVGLASKPSSFYLLSLLCKRDLYQYISAVLSLLQYVTPEKIIIVNDGSLSDEDLIVISNIIGAIEFRSLDEFSLPGLPKGGCWERIVAISEYSKESYVMQLDADTLFMREPIELLESIEKKKSFCLPTISGFTTCNLYEAQAFALAMISVGGDFIQYDLEAKLSIMGDPEQNKYIRACAGLAGYAKNVITYENLVAISDTYRECFNEKWDSWGTEQFVSNYILANTDELIILPINEYNSVDMYSENLTFIHFIGSYRFKSGYYLSCTRKLFKI